MTSAEAWRGRVQGLAHLVLWVLVATSLYGGYLVLPGLQGHSLFSILAKILVFPTPFAALFFMWRFRPRAMAAVAVFTAWLLWVGTAYLMHPYHTYFVQYYVWSQVTGWLIVLALWLLARHPVWIRLTWQVALPLFWVATLGVALWEAHTGHHIGPSAVPGRHIPNAFYFNPNDLGAALALLIPYMWFWYEVVPGQMGKMGAVVLTAVSLYVLVETGSRGGELALMLDLVALPAVLPARARLWAVGALIVSVAGGIGLVAWARSQGPIAHLPRYLSKLARLPNLFTVHIPAHVKPGQAPGSVAIRWALYRSGLQALLQHPLGLGPRGAERWYTYWLHHASPYNTYGITNAHNLWLEIAMDFGWPGFILFVGAYILLLRYALVASRSRDPLVRGLGCAGFPALIGFILGALSPSSVMIGFLAMWVVFGLVIAAERLPRPAD